MIVAYVRCSDGPEGEWHFDILPRVGEDVVLRGVVKGDAPHIYYQVRKVEHYPSESGRDMDRSIALYLDPTDRSGAPTQTARP
jgi:hypothetical protein